MKVKLLIVCTFFIKLTFGQVWLIDFDSTGPLNSLFIDTIANKQNIWQIGVPDKPGFESAYSLPNVICTDLHKSYPVNDTSVFGIKTKIIKSDGSFEGMYISGRYKIDSDSLTDYGSIEFSADSGKLWYDLLADTNYLEAYCIQTNNEKTDFTGRKMKWHSFQFFLNSACFDIWFEKIILIKFSFISDSIQTNKAGWMIDDIEFDYIFESVEEVKSKPY
ncbi:hypothetical protein GC194_12650, partial [bacterium]|nr:hypothetical protein [bacterium]